MNLLLRHSVVLALVALVAPASSEAAPAPSKVKTQPKATSKARAPERPARRAVIPSFRQIYERDAAELRAQTRALSAALSAARSANTRRESRLEAQVKGLMKRLSKVRAEVTSLESELTREREKGMASDNNLSLVRTAQRVAVSKLRGLGADLAPIGKDEPREKALQRLVKEALGLGERFGTVHSRPGAFYDAKGQQVQGTIVWLGRVGALGLGKSDGGILRPAPGGGLRLHDGAAKATAERLSKGEVLAHIPFFLFDERDPPQTGEGQKGLAMQLKKGGPIAWIIVGLALLGLLLVFERLILLLLRHNWRPGALRRVEEALAKGQRPAIPRGSGCVGAVLRRLLATGSRERKVLEDRAAEAVLQRIPALERSFTVITVIVAVAPLLGLLGTVTGMIATFDVITQFGTGDPKLLSGGISEALITTKLGLSVAVPLLLLRSFLSRWSDRLVEEMQTQSLTLINALDDVNVDVADNVSDVHEEHAP